MTEKIMKFRSIEDLEEFEEDFEGTGKLGYLTINFPKSTFRLHETYRFKTEKKKKEFYGTVERKMEGEMRYDEKTSFVSLEKSKMFCQVIKKAGGKAETVEKEVGPTVFRLDRDTDNLEAVAFRGSVRWWYVDEDDEDY